MPADREAYGGVSGNCDPRMPALQLQVKRETPNKGRMFYTCQKDRKKSNKCNFFLWTEDARAREVGAVLSNSRSEPQTPTTQRRPPSSMKQTTLHTSISPKTEGRRRDKTPVTSLADLEVLTRGGSSPSSATQDSATVRGSSSGSPISARSDRPTGHTRGANEPNTTGSMNAEPTNARAPFTPSSAGTGLGTKRKRDDQDDEYSDLSAGEEEELVAIASRSGAKRPTIQAPTAGAPPTPLTGKPVRRVLFADQVEGSNGQPSAASATTKVATPPSSSPSSGDDVTHEVMALLKGQPVDEGVLRAVRSALERHAARARGLERGRDASRDAARRSAERIEALQARVASLENDRKMDAEHRRSFRSELLDLYGKM
jgi:hypothetical protein